MILYLDKLYLVAYKYSTKKNELESYFLGNFFKMSFINIKTSQMSIPPFIKVSALHCNLKEAILV